MTSQKLTLSKPDRYRTVRDYNRQVSIKFHPFASSALQVQIKLRFLHVSYLHQMYLEKIKEAIEE